ncbi:MAG TPA: YceI family protein [Thermoanaerobaculia bacterium]
MTDTAPLYLHIGCGNQRLEGWVNVDLQNLPEVDVVADVTEGLPFAGAVAVFAEHFLEHLRLDHGLAFLREVHRVLAPGGWLRLSTPNLDWVLSTHYDLEASERQAMGLQLNRAFRGWGHQFLWNRHLLAEALLACGFTDLRWCGWGESEQELFRGLERHETYNDRPDLPHVLIVEARRGEPQPERWQAARAMFEENFLFYLRSPRHWLDPYRSRIVARFPVHGPLAFLVREHVVRVTELAGSVVWHPEAPEAAEIELTVPADALAVDEPADRRAYGLRRLPERLRRRFRHALIAWQLHSAAHPTIMFRAMGLERLTPGRYRIKGELTVRGATRPLETEVTIAVAGIELRAEGAISLRPSDFGVPPYRQGRGLLRGRDKVELSFALVAVASSPT